jgi:hypothetical protein
VYPVNTDPAAHPPDTLLRSGDDLFRLALLLAPDAGSAVQALATAISRFANTGAALDEPALLAALLDALPERRTWRRRIPAWALAPRGRAAQAPLLAAIARLPRRQRLALGLTLLRGSDAAQAAALVGGGEAVIREQVRDALLALAPYVASEGGQRTSNGWVARTLGADAPEECRPTRAALALNTIADASPAARGHLALCEACRAAEQAWQRLHLSVEQALRGALRDAHMPADLLEGARATGALTRGLRADIRLRIALVALPVLFIVALLVVPRGGSGVAQFASLGGLSPPPAPRVLIQHARASLYALPAGQGAWHARYEIRWSFAGGTYAMLAADQWLDPSAGRHRLQLVHKDGGGPYELQLADGAQTAWYAVSEVYAPSIYPLSAPETSSFHLRFPATPEEQRELLSARLKSGAWDLPAAYLRQAETASEIRAWGRQRGADGAVVSLLGFAGYSPLAPPDTPEATIGPITILLAIDETSGRLREVRELLGPDGGEQLTRTTWRFVGEEWIGDQQEIGRAFDIKRAWNGVGGFVGREQVAHPALPVAQRRGLTPLALAIQRQWTGIWLPDRPPVGAQVALLINGGVLPIHSNSVGDDERLTLVYIGEGRRLELRTDRVDREPPLRGADGRITMPNGQPVVLRGGPAQSYEAQIAHTSQYGEELVTRVAARGYTRAELLDVIATLGPPTLDGYRAQASLFADQFPHEAGFEALLGALAPPAAMRGDTARHIVARVFARQDGASDPLADPYHRPRYDGIPERSIQEMWVRGTPESGDMQLVFAGRDLGGAPYWRLYADNRRMWVYNAELKQTEQYTAGIADLELQHDQRIQLILQMLGCGRLVVLSRAGGGITVSLTDTIWQSDSCLRPSYPDLLRAQISDYPEWALNRAPYLADVRDEAITAWIDLGSDSRIVRAEVRAGTTRDGILLEAWEIERDQQAQAGSFSETIFNPTPPDTLVRWRYPDAVLSVDQTPHAISTSQARDFMQTPVFGLPAPSGFITASEMLTGTAALSATLMVAEAGAPMGQAPHWYGGDQTALLRALLDGYAIRLTYGGLNMRDGSPIVQIYEGPAPQLGAYLRATGRWLTSAPVTLKIEGQQVSGWQIAGIRGGRWTLFELEGTLIAIEYPFERAAEIAAGLERIPRR